ncbi:hypothetical protein A2Z22_00400 [Candidatus Woesebacteria bacterium RBG_16_34_12]|uniref:Uncharacterized protein n=1 Tax=Candidatus Woesebacteria bacterium RBG_16_34_12 TaxID=1802480 RepID=A0A1F7X8Z5_9BACT|nr:MAG: hypothetical protein A2Z22_00400 [Candidatus Woesebacteria bacterium RBG_16_34_12]
MRFIITDTVLETPHVIVGAAIAIKVVNPALALPLAFGSHFLLEKIPHWNPHLNSELKKFGKITNKSTKIIILDASCALVIGSYLSSLVLPNLSYALTIFFSCFLSVLPDLVEAPYFFLNYRNKKIDKWIGFQKVMQENASLLPGLFSQLLVVFAALWWISV